MIRAFLSHSSSDKNRYVRLVADKLGADRCVYDEYTFEAGMKPLEEIMRGLDSSTVFVVFLSRAALSSSWVQKELFLARERLTQNQLVRVFPILIDPTLTHEDPAIPVWLREDYNLKYISRPVIAARRIKQRLREIAWLSYPSLRERDSIFVGRNDLVNQIEQRVDDFSLEPPVCYIASGLTRIGRSSLLRHAIMKSNLVRSSYDFPTITLKRGESIEDLILKLFDLGFSDVPYPKNLMSLDLGAKVDMAEALVRDLTNARETIIVKDDGCIIDNERSFQEWFEQLICRVAATARPIFLVTVRFRPRPAYLKDRQYVFSVDVPEMSFLERQGLFKRLLEIEEIQLTRDDFGFFLGLLHGYPDQVRFAVDLIRSDGVAQARSAAHQLTEFNSDRAAKVLDKYADKKTALDFLFLLSEFEFVSLDFLFMVVDEAEYAPLLQEFIASCICDYVGIEREFVRLNDIIRDFVRRNRVALPQQFQSRLQQLLGGVFDSQEFEESDMSQQLYTLTQGIKAGTKLPEEYLIPSHFLRSIRELYQQRGRLNRVIELADRLLSKEHELDRAVAHDIRYYLCLSLAKKRDSRALKEVMMINGPDHNFLLGFYYRQVGRADDAIKHLTKCLDYPAVSSRAKRELVQVLLFVENYEEAAVLAKTNYEENRRNPYHIQGYFNAVVNSRNVLQSKQILQRLIDELESVKSDVAEQMAIISRAEYTAKCLGDYNGALDIINDAIAKYSDLHYPLLTKAFLAANNLDLQNLQSSYEGLREMSRERTISASSLSRLECYTHVLRGDLVGAKALAQKELSRYPKDSLNAFLQRLDEMAQRVQ